MYSIFILFIESLVSGVKKSNYCEKTADSSGVGETAAWIIWLSYFIKRVGQKAFRPGSLERRMVADHLNILREVEPRPAFWRTFTHIIFGYII